MHLLNIQLSLTNGLFDPTLSYIAQRKVGDGMSVRVKDIAAAVGVSPTTVSLVLNNKPGAGEKLRERILRTAKDLGYAAPKGARAGSLCLLHIARHGHTVNRDHDVFIADYIEGLSHEAKLGGIRPRDRHLQAGADSAGPRRRPRRWPRTASSSSGPS